MQDNQSGVQGILTLSYNSHKEKDKVTSSAVQLSAGDSHSVVLLEYKQQKELEHEDYNNKDCVKYSIDANKLVSLIEEYGTKL